MTAVAPPTASARRLQRRYAPPSVSRSKMRPMPKQGGSTPVPLDWEPTPGVKIPTVREPARPRIRIGGEMFFIEIEDGFIYLRHPMWSLVGIGNTIYEAERNLRADARELAEVMSAMPLNTMDHDALDLFRYVLRIA